MIKLRAMSYRQDNERLAMILRELQRINAIKIIEQSKPYSNKGNSIQERVYYDIEINPNIVNTPKHITKINILYGGKNENISI